MSGISQSGPLKRFEGQVQSSWKGKKVDDKGQYVLTHLRIPLSAEHNVDVIVYSTETILISSSPNLPRDQFERVADQVARTAQTSLAPVSVARPVTALRARSLLDYSKSLNLDNELERMISVVICDTSNEILLTERMKEMGIQGPPLEEGIPRKISILEEKSFKVYRASDIKNVRESRNSIVHKGQIPHKIEAQTCLEVSNDVYSQL